MKKLLLALVLAVTVALCLGQVAFAETATEQKACELAKANDKVTEAHCVIYERCCVVAIKTEKFASKTEYEEYVKELCEKVKTECEVDHVIVTRNPKAMKQMVELNKLEGQKRTEAIEKLIEEAKQHKPHGRPMLPKMTADVEITTNI